MKGWLLRVRAMNNHPIVISQTYIDIGIAAIFTCYGSYNCTGKNSRCPPVGVCWRKAVSAFKTNDIACRPLSCTIMYSPWKYDICHIVATNYGGFDWKWTSDCAWKCPTAGIYKIASAHFKTKRLYSERTSKQWMRATKSVRFKRFWGAVVHWLRCRSVYRLFTGRERFIKNIKTANTEVSL